MSGTLTGQVRRSSLVAREVFGVAMSMSIQNKKLSHSSGRLDMLLSLAVVFVVRIVGCSCA